MEDAIGDVDGLHSKLDRKTRVETSNSAAAQKFQNVSCVDGLQIPLPSLFSSILCCSLQSIEGDFEQMQHNLEEFHSSQKQFCQSFSQRIGKSTFLCM